MYPDDVTQLSLIGSRFVIPKFQARFEDPSSKSKFSGFRKA